MKNAFSIIFSNRDLWLRQKYFGFNTQFKDNIPMKKMKRMWEQTVNQSRFEKMLKLKKCLLKEN